MADQGLFQSSQYSQALLAQRREIASDAAEGHSTRRRAEAARDLLLDLHHADIALREAVVERHGEVVQEQQHRLLVLGQAIEQIASRRLFASPFLDDWRRIGLIAFVEQSFIAYFPVLHFQWMQTRSPLGTGLLDRLYWLLSISVPKSGSKQSFGNPSCE